MPREWLVIEDSRKNCVFAPEEARNPKGYIPRDEAEKLLGRDLGSTQWFTVEESAKFRAHPEWRTTPPSESAPVSSTAPGADALYDVAKVERATDAMDAMADAWAVEVGLHAMIENIVSPMRLNRNAPEDVRANFTGRMKDQISAVVRMAFTEATYRAYCAGKDSARAPAPQEVDEWCFDMEKAPRDGSEVLLYYGTLSDHWSRRIIGFWRDGHWVWQSRAYRGYSSDPTAWRPLPASTSAQEGDR